MSQNQNITFFQNFLAHLVCVLDGTIIYIFGPFNATVNDAKIMSQVLSSDRYLRELLKKDDVLVADRGFRDCRKSIKKEYKIDVIISKCNLRALLNYFIAIIFSFLRSS